MLSTHLSLKEFTHSDTAKRLKLDNRLEHSLMDNARNTAITFEIIRVISGNKPMHINSGYRGKSLNKAVGGVKHSDHCKGLAIDIRMADAKECVRVAKLVMKYVPKQFIRVMILERHGHAYWIHISSRPDFNAPCSETKVISYDSARLKAKYKPWYGIADPFQQESKLTHSDQAQNWSSFSP